MNPEIYTQTMVQWMKQYPLLDHYISQPWKEVIAQQSVTLLQEENNPQMLEAMAAIIKETNTRILSLHSRLDEGPEEILPQIREIVWQTALNHWGVMIMQLIAESNPGQEEETDPWLVLSASQQYYQMEQKLSQQLDSRDQAATLVREMITQEYYR